MIVDRCYNGHLLEGKNVRREPYVMKPSGRRVIRVVCMTCHRVYARRAWRKRRDNLRALLNMVRNTILINSERHKSLALRDHPFWCGRMPPSGSDYCWVSALRHAYEEITGEKLGD